MAVSEFYALRKKAGYALERCLGLCFSGKTSSSIILLSIENKKGCKCSHLKNQRRTLVLKEWVSDEAYGGVGSFPYSDRVCAVRMIMGESVNVNF